MFNPTDVNKYLIAPFGPDPEERGFTAIDLFAGAGGISLGLQNAGFRVLLASDISADCQATHETNFPSVPFLRGDLSEVSGSGLRRAAGIARNELDLLIGGPPCQGFSILGQREIKDPRNKLLYKFIELVGELKPRVAIIENVPGLATLEGGTVLRNIGTSFRRLGYEVDCAELLAAQYGVPQMRWRMFFIAWRSDLNRKFAGFPLPTHGSRAIGDLVPNRPLRPEDSAGFVNIRQAIGDLGKIAHGELGTKYRHAPRSAFQQAMRAYSTSVTNHYAPRLSAATIERISYLAPGQDWRDLPTHLLPAGMQRALRKDHTRRYRRMTWTGIARSIITRFRDPKSGEYTHPDQDRTISIREAARIQSFPDWFKFEGGYTSQYEQVGNAVPALLAKAVASEIAASLTSNVARTQVKSRYKVNDRALANV